MDKVNLRILDVLQQDATAKVADVAAAVNLSTTACWKRIQQLEASGVIRKRVTLLDPDKLNVGVTVFVSIRTSRHTETWLRQFAATVTTIPEVVEIYRMSGEVDYLLRVVVPDIKAYDGVYRKLIRGVELADVSSSFAMERIKYTTALPLDYVT